MAKLLILIIFISLYSCAPKKDIQFKGVKNITIDILANGQPSMKADVDFYNPNPFKMKIKEINIAVFVDDKKTALIDHSLDIKVAPQSDFSVPIVATLSLKEMGLLNTVFGLLGGKKYNVLITGFIRVKFKGVTIKVPVKQLQQLSLNNK